MAKSCVATGWFSAPCGGNRRFSTHLSPLSRLIYRGLQRKPGIFFRDDVTDSLPRLLPSFIRLCAYLRQGMWEFSPPRLDTLSRRLAPHNAA
jgi:hypothetical protein